MFYCQCWPNSLKRVRQGLGSKLLKGGYLGDYIGEYYKEDYYNTMVYMHG